jgi:DNA-binding phage protein
MRSASAVLSLSPSYRSGLLAAVREVLAPYEDNLAGIARFARMPLPTLRLLLSNDNSHGLLAAFECFLRTQGAKVQIAIDLRSRPLTLAALPQAYLNQAVATLVGMRTPKYELTAPTPRMASQRASASVDIYQAGIRDDLAKPLAQRPPKKVASLVALVHEILVARSEVAVLTWNDQALTISAGIYQKKVRNAIRFGTTIPVTTALDRLMSVLGMRLIVTVSHREWTLGEAHRLPALAKVRQIPTRIPRPQVALGRSELIHILLDLVEKSTRTLTEVAAAAGVSDRRLQRWKESGTDRELVALESVIAALGGTITITLHKPTRVITVPAPEVSGERHEVSMRDLHGILRHATQRDTDLEDEELTDEIVQEIERRRHSLRAALKKPLTGTPEQYSGLAKAMRALLRRRQAEPGAPVWGVTDLMVVTGVPRGALSRLLAMKGSNDAEHDLVALLTSFHATLACQG